MKKLLFPLFSIFFTIAFSQIEKMNECDFFDYLKDLQKNHYNNPTFTTAYSTFSTRKEILKKLESYFIVFRSYSIAPMHLQSGLNEQITPKQFKVSKYACSVFLEEFNTEYSKSRNVKLARETVQKNKYIDISDLLLKLTDLDKEISYDVEKYLAEFEYSLTFELLFEDIKVRYFNDTGSPLENIPAIIKEKNLELLAKRMDKLDQSAHSYYENYHSKANFAKGFEMYHDNDVFLCAPGMNQDREYTGGFKFTIITDYLKWRWLRPGIIPGINKIDNTLTYQTISLGGVGYTPYIRYRNNFELADSLYSYDRPFSSTMYIERAKHRTWRNGLIRQKGEFQIGAIGISQGRKIQAKLHADVIHSSQFVHGWDQQVANGGRLFIQANQKFDFLIFSNTNRYRKIFKPKHYLVEEPVKQNCSTGSCRKYGGLNLIAETDLKLGTFITSVGGGLRFSTLDFLKQSGNQMINSRINSPDNFGWKFDIGINYRYIIHNSLLEGVGFTETFAADKYDQVASDTYLLKPTEIERNMFILDFGVNLKFRKTTVFFRQNFHTLEYKSKLSDINFDDPKFTSLIDSDDEQFYQDKIVKEQNSFLNNKLWGRTIYGFGTLGVSWIIE